MAVPQKRTRNTALTVLVLLAMLVLAVYIGIEGWTMGGGESGGQVTVLGYLAMALGIAATLALGIGLMVLVFYSARRGKD